MTAASRAGSPGSGPCMTGHRDHRRPGRNLKSAPPTLNNTNFIWLLKSGRGSPGPAARRTRSPPRAEARARLRAAQARRGRLHRGALAQAAGLAQDEGGAGGQEERRHHARRPRPPAPGLRGGGDRGRIVRASAAGLRRPTADSDIGPGGRLGRFKRASGRPRPGVCPSRSPARLESAPLGQPRQSAQPAQPCCARASYRARRTPRLPSSSLHGEGRPSIGAHPPADGAPRRHAASTPSLKDGGGGPGTHHPPRARLRRQPVRLHGPVAGQAQQLRRLRPAGVPRPVRPDRSLRGRAMQRVPPRAVPESGRSTRPLLRVAVAPWIRQGSRPRSFRGPAGLHLDPARAGGAPRTPPRAAVAPDAGVPGRLARHAAVPSP